MTASEVLEPRPDYDHWSAGAEEIAGKRYNSIPWSGIIGNLRFGVTLFLGGFPP